MRYAGKDISHWFDNFTREPIKHTDPMTGKHVYFTIEGLFLHVPDLSKKEEMCANPWWKGAKYCIGSMTVKERQIKIVNMLTKHEDIITVCDNPKFLFVYL